MPSRKGAKNIAIVQGHPDAAEPHFGVALADAYAAAATAAGHAVRTITPAKLRFPLLRSAHEYAHGELPAALRQAQDDIGWAEHLVLAFPLWLGDMPALLKGFLEQIARPGFAFRKDAKNPFGIKGLTGRSARVVVTMGMPALVYRYYFRAHSVRNLERNILGFVGFAPIHTTLIGSVETVSDANRARWLAKLAALGRAGA
jgi:putative NADPH-quinone reductase